MSWGGNGWGSGEPVATLAADEWNSGGQQAASTNEWDSGNQQTAGADERAGAKSEAEANDNNGNFGGGENDATNGNRDGQDASAFDGTCNLCGKDGHRKRDCPDKPAEVCANCQSE